MIVHLHYAVKHTEQNLLKQHSQENSGQKGSRAKQRIFPHIQPGNLLFFHTDQQIDSKLFSAFFQHKAHHVVYQPRDNQQNEKSSNSHHHRDDACHLKHPLNILRKNQSVKGKHQSCNKRHGKKIDQVVSG